MLACAAGHGAACSTVLGGHRTQCVISGFLSVLRLLQVLLSHTSLPCCVVQHIMYYQSHRRMDISHLPPFDGA